MSSSPENPASNYDYLLKLLRRGQRESARSPLCWVGAGLSIPAGYPSWGELAERIRKASLIRLPPSDDPLETVDAFVCENGRGELDQLLAGVFVAKPSLPYHRDLVRLPWGSFVTTNYDELLEDALRQVGRGFLPVTLERNLDLTPGPHLPLYKILGSGTGLLLKKPHLTGRSNCRRNGKRLDVHHSIGTRKPDCGRCRSQPVSYAARVSPRFFYAPLKR